MGLYAESQIEILCDKEENARAVWKAVIEKSALMDDSPFVVSVVSMDGNIVYGNMSSGRVQNLEYQCEQLWDFISGMEGVESMSCPFMIEGDGMSFYREEDGDNSA